MNIKIYLREDVFITDYYSKCCLVGNKNGIDFLEKHQNRESPRLLFSDEFQVSRNKIKVGHSG